MINLTQFSACKRIVQNCFGKSAGSGFFLQVFRYILREHDFILEVNMSHKTASYELHSQFAFRPR